MDVGTTSTNSGVKSALQSSGHMCLPKNEPRPTKMMEEAGKLFGGYVSQGGYGTVGGTRLGFDSFLDALPINFWAEETGKNITLREIKAAVIAAEKRPHAIKNPVIEMYLPVGAQIILLTEMLGKLQELCHGEQLSQNLCTILEGTLRTLENEIQGHSASFKRAREEVRIDLAAANMVHVRNDHGLSEQLTEMLNVLQQRTVLLDDVIDALGME